MSRNKPLRLRPLRPFRLFRLLALCGFAVANIAVAFACSTPDTSARIDPIGPDRASFEIVAKVLVRKCGTLDCHGETHRNFRLYGYGGLRLPSDGRRPDVGGGDIGSDELEADYQAVISVEPEIMRQVVLDKGAAPERLTLVRKARGTEEHKGKSAVLIGDDADKCITTWLASAVDNAACARVLPSTAADASSD
jgi:hypothetical protein